MKGSLKDRNRRFEGAELFFLEGGVIVLGGIAHFEWFFDVLSDLQHCWPGWRISGTDLDLLVILYWGHAAGYWIYLVLFASWLLRRWPPWATKNPLFFTPQGRNMWRAWDDAIARMLAIVTGGNAPPARRWRYRLEFALALWTAVSSLVLAILVQTCEHCPSDPLGNCTAHVGTVAVGLGTIALYYDLRIKFGSRTGQA